MELYMDPKASPRDPPHGLPGRFGSVRPAFPERMSRARIGRRRERKKGEPHPREYLREKTGQLTQRLYGFACYERRGEEIVLSEEFRERKKGEPHARE